MKMKILYKTVIILSIVIITGCGSKSVHNNQDTTTNSIEQKEDKKDINNNSNEEINSVKILIDNKEYIINLENNNTVKTFLNTLPLELDMSELNGNEKYVYLDNTLPTNSYSPKHINAGDVMLFGNNCLVLFYKSFDTSYSYTKIGHIDNLPNLESGNIKVKIEK